MTISQVAAKYNLTPDTLRYYEKAGIISPVRKNLSGLRDYDENACKEVELALALRAFGVPIRALAEYADLTRQGEQTMAQRRHLLEQQRALLLDRMADLHRQLALLDQNLSAAFGNIQQKSA